jgi:hypothetical protein
MNNKPDVKPISAGYIGHSHRWQPMQIKNIFEPIDQAANGVDLVYTMVEYAYLSCMCGPVIKSRVRNNPNETA